MLWYERVKQAIKLQADIYAPMYAQLKAQAQSLQDAAGSPEMSRREYKRYAAPNGVTDTAYTDYADETTDTNATDAMNRRIQLQDQLEAIDMQFLRKMEPLFTVRL